ncbi:MAG TPA: DNA/RNA nuclease SfsA [Pseudomonadales bacterium]|nr:DNA/RNA nuclease SfsA [Pseudomonadales bacterium]
MRFPDDYQVAELVRRYKRFLADVRLPTGDVVTVHCPNTGAMTGCAEPGSRVWLQPATNPKAKYEWGWRFVETPQGLVNIYSAGANTLFTEAFVAGRLAFFEGYTTCHTEISYAGGASRADALLSGHPQKPPCLVEVKSVTLCGTSGCGYFPDTRSERAVKHIQHLSQAIERGMAAALVFVIQHQGIDRVEPAAHIHPEYAAVLQDAIVQGLQIVTLKANLDAGHYRIT